MGIPPKIKADLERLGIENPQRWYQLVRKEAPRHYNAESGTSIEQFRDHYVREQLTFLKMRIAAERRNS